MQEYQGNYHTHTEWCNHGSIKAEQAVQEAVSVGLEEIGFTEHAPFYDDRFFRMKYAEIPDYFAELLRLKKIWKSKIRILIGFEIEFFSDETSYYQALLQNYPLDYLLLGQHYFQSDSSVIKTTMIQDTSQILQYAVSISEALQTGLFRILAHPDYCFSCDLPFDQNVKKSMQMIIHAAEATGTIMEINANGFRKPKFESKQGFRRKYPLQAFWNMAANSSVKTIIGSDAHHPRTICDSAVEQAFQFAEMTNVSIMKYNLLSP